ncbi:MAG: sigma-70 family RNA polymerase sigma factor [Candidatus Obscuribacterales bacterium]|nr:sigma-70 family RNA polymerase sigma factor [Candidatus Obscuribacterales bacterium]
MARLPSRMYSDSAAASTLLEVKKGGREAMGEFVYQHVDRFYCIAFIGTLDPEAAENITVEAMRNVMTALRNINPKQFSQGGVWEWVSGFIVDAVANWHANYSQAPAGPITDPTMDGSSQMDWETTVILGTQRVKRCISLLQEDQKKVFILRHQLNLNFAQVAAVLNENEDNVMAWLHRARVQVVKCLGRG